MSADYADDTQNPFAMAARTAKAEAMAGWLRQLQVTGEQVEQMSEEGWRSLAALANVTPPSDTTKAMVIGCLSMPQTTGRF